MKLHYFSHRHADKILASCGLLQELDRAFDDLPVPIFPGKSNAKAANSDKQVILQALLNTIVELKLVSLGWLPQPLVKASAGAAKTRYYADFYKKAHAEEMTAFVGPESAQVQALMEVQFANTSRLDSDLKKFNIAFVQGRCDVGIIVVPLKSMANDMSTNVANYDYVIDGLRELGPLMAPVPVLVIGLAEDETPRLDMSNSDFDLDQLTGTGSKKRRIASAYAILTGAPVENIGPHCELPSGSDYLIAGGGEFDCPENPGPSAEILAVEQSSRDNNRDEDCGLAENVIVYT